MSGRIIFLVEEPSMATLLDQLLPRLVPGWVRHEHFQCVPHEGKTDLDRSISRKLLAWREPNVRFVVVRDNDNADCLALKGRLLEQCRKAKRPETLIRLVCQELESWYLGDMEALRRAYPNQKFNVPRHAKRFAEPDSWNKPSIELKSLIPSYQKLAGARLIAPNLNVEHGSNKSRSYAAFIEGVARVVAEQANT
ncbi:DUF4276 family protein [Caballeronia ptereochthonis]|uniref:DUF4276 family protein n=1 Tax=Caballeronia ptereochthonis TaxID=1777144 RepID=UPI000B35E9E5|nr:DUF4276 family protein [Caballeronia ptereochthonis]